MFWDCTVEDTLSVAVFSACVASVAAQRHLSVYCERWNNVMTFVLYFRGRRTYHHEAIKNEAQPRGLKRIKKALYSGPQEAQQHGETDIEVAV